MVKFKVPLKDILGRAYYQYELSSSNYNPHIDETITITCICKNILGNPIPNKELTLMMNGIEQGTSTTNELGIATWSITFRGWGNKHFYIGNATLDLMVIGWKLVETKESNKVKVYANENMVALSIQDTFTLTANGTITIATISSMYAPNYQLTTNFHPTTHNIKTMIGTDGQIIVYNNSSATSGKARIYVTYPKKANMP